MPQPPPDKSSDSHVSWPLVAAIVFLVISLAIAGVIISGVDPASLLPRPPNPPSVSVVRASPTIAATGLPPTQPTATPGPEQRLMRITLSPPQGDTSGLSQRLPDAIRAALAGSPLAQEIQIDTEPASAEQTILLVEWSGDTGGPIVLTIYSQFEPALVSVGGSLTPYSIVGPETTPLIVDPAGDAAQPGGLVAGLLELALQPDVHTLDKLQGLQALPSNLTLEDQARNQAVFLFAIGQAQAALGNPTGALETYSQALRQQSDFPAALLNRANVYMTVGDIATAQSLYETINDLQPYQTIVQYNRAIATLAGSDKDAALRSADELVSANPSAAWSVNLRGYIRYQRAEYDAALADFKQASDRAPQMPVPLFNQAQALMAVNEADQALTVYQALLALEPNKPLYHFAQGQAFEAAGKPSDALDAFSQAIALDDQYVEAYVERAGLEVQQKDYDQALADANQALALDPNSGPAYQVIGDSLLAQEEWIKAEKAYTAAADNGVSTIDLFAGRGWAHHRQRELDSAIADYQQAISLGDEDTTVMLRLGFALLDTNQKKDALNVLLGAVNGGLDTAEAHAGLSLALDMNYRVDEANQEYQRALALDAMYGDRKFLADQPLWTTATIGRAMAIVNRLK